MKKSFLFLLDYLPPFVSANGICVEGVMKALQKNYKCYSISLNTDLTSKGSNYYIPLRKWDQIVKLSQNLKKENKNLAYLFLRVLIVLKKCLMISFWPVFSFSTVLNFYKKASRVIKNKTVSAVIAVSYPGETFLALVLLKLRFGKRIKTILYPLDVSLGGKFNGSFVERKISVVSSKFLYRFCSFFSDKIIVLENTLDLYEKNLSSSSLKKIELCGIPLIKQEPVTVNPFNDKEICLVYGGNVDSRVRNPIPLFDYLENASIVHSCLIKVDIYGVVDKRMSDIIHSKYQKLNIVIHGWVDEKTLNEAIARASALISVGNNVEHLIPSKIFKYMSLNKPIIHQCSIKNDPCIPYLKKYGHSFVLNAKENVDCLNILEWIKENSTFVVDCCKLFPRCTPEYTAEKIANT